MGGVEGHTGALGMKEDYVSSGRDGGKGSSNIGNGVASTEHRGDGTSAKYVGTGSWCFG